MPQTLSIQTTLSTCLSTLISIPPTLSSLPTLLLLHFWGGTNSTYAPLISHLSNRYPIIAPTFRGWGGSSKPQGSSSGSNASDPTYSLSTNRDDISALLSSLVKTHPKLFLHGVVLVGHSMGAKIALGLLSHLPKDNPKIGIRGLVLLAPAPPGSFALPTEAMRIQQMGAYGSAISAEHVVRNVLLGRSSRVDEETVREIVEGAVSGSAGAKRAWPVEGMGMDWEDGVRRSVGEDLSQKGKILRVLVLAGEEDVVESVANVEERVVRVLADAGADVRFEILAGVGHLSPIEAPAEIARLLEGFVGTD